MSTSGDSTIVDPEPPTERPGRTRRIVKRSRQHFSGAKERSKEVGLLMFGRLWMTGANSILMLVLSVWLLDLTTWGLFITAVGAQLALSRIVLLGVDQGVIRLFTVDDEGSASRDVVRTALSSTLLIAIPMLVGGLVIAGLDLSSIHALLNPVILASIAIGACGQALFDYGYSVHLSRLEYRSAALLYTEMPSLRLIATMVVAWLAGPESHSSFLAYAAVGLLFGAREAVQVGSRSGYRPPRPAIFDLWRYTRWIGLADVAMIVGLQLGLFLLGFMGRETEAGIFGFSLTIGTGFFAIYLAFYQAILPRAARIESAAAIPRFLGRVYTMAIALVAVCVPIAWAIGAFLPELMTAVSNRYPEHRMNSELAEFAPSFYGYAAFTMLLILEAPLAVTCHYLLRPQIQLVAMVIRCAAIGGFGLWLVPDGGAVGAGQAQALGAGVGFIALAVAVSGAIRTRMRESTKCAES